MLLKGLSACVLLFLGSIVHSQTVIDSLQSELDRFDHREPGYVKTLTLLAKEYAETHPDTALVLAQNALEMSDRLKWDSLKGQIFVAFSSGHSYLADYQSSNEFSFKAIAEAEKFGDTLTLIDAFNNLGIDNLMLEEDARAIEYFGKVEELSRIFGDSLRWGHALNNLGLMEGYADRTMEELGYYDQAAAIFLAINEKEGYANTLLNSGTTYTVLEQFDHADRLYRQALMVFEELEMSSGVQNTMQSRAENLMMKGDYLEAKELAMEALAIAQEFEFAQDEIYTYELLSQIAVKSGDYESAYKFQTSGHEVKQEIFTTEKSKQIAELESKYQTEKKEQELAIANLELGQRTLQNYLLVGALSLVLIIGGLIILGIRQKASLKQRLLAEEVENLRLKINSLLGDNESLGLDLAQLNQKLHQPLSDREFEILNLTISDKTNKEIADEVFVSVNTVKFHLKNVYEKLGVSNRKEALHLIVGQT